jgi:translation initiation factor 2 subunit 2
MTEIKENNMFEISINDVIDTQYNFLLNNLFEELEANKTVISAGKDEKVTLPDVVFDISKKTIWKNFKINCKELNRNEKDICNFFKSEYQRSNSINKLGQLLIPGKYTTMVNSTFKKYIKMFVQCSVCKSIKTDIIINHRMGLDYIVCNNCKIEKSIIKQK